MFDIFRKSDDKIQVLLKSDKFNDALREEKYTFFYYISHSSSYNEKYFRQNL